MHSRSDRAACSHTATNRTTTSFLAHRCTSHLCREWHQGGREEGFSLSPSMFPTAANRLSQATCRAHTGRSYKHPLTPSRRYRRAQAPPPLRRLWESASGPVDAVIPIPACLYSKQLPNDLLKFKKQQKKKAQQMG